MEKFKHTFIMKIKKTMVKNGKNTKLNLVLLKENEENKPEDPHSKSTKPPLTVGR